MSQEYYGNNGEQFSINVNGTTLLNRLTLCLWDKVGIPRPLSNEEALLISRILDNYITLQKVTMGDESYSTPFWSKYGLQQDHVENLEVTIKISNFFKRCDGLMTEEDVVKNQSKPTCDNCGTEMQYEGHKRWFCIHCGTIG